MSCYPMDPWKPGSDLNDDVVEVVVRCEVVSHVGEDHTVLEDGEDRVDAWLAVAVVTPVEVEGGSDAGEVRYQEILLPLGKFS